MTISRRALKRLCVTGPLCHRRFLTDATTRCFSSGTTSTATSESAEASHFTENTSAEGSSQQNAASEATGAPDSTGMPQAEPVPSRKSPFWTTMKVFLSGSLAAGLLASAYASYAYTSEEIEKRISGLRALDEVKDPKQDSLLQKVVYANTVKAVSEVAELYLKMRKAIEDQVKGFAAPTSDKLLPDLLPQEKHVFTLVIDLNETLVYSDWTRDRGWKTFKRPGAEAFLEHLAQFYELIIYTDQLPYTVDPILEKLDQKGCIRYRLAREATQYIHGKHFKDLSKLNRDPAHVLFLSAHAKESCLQPENAVPVKPWKLEPNDTSLLDMLPFLEYVARHRPADVRSVLASYDGHDIPLEFLARTKDYQKKMRELKSQNPFFRSSR